MHGRQDLRRSHEVLLPLTGRPELPFVALAAFVIVAIAQITDPGRWFELVLLTVAGCALVASAAVTAVAADVIAVAVIVPASIAVGAGGHLQVGLFLVTLITLQSGAELTSTLRAAAVAVGSAAAMVLVAVLQPDDVTAAPWIAAEIFTFVLGRTLSRQRALIVELEKAREALAEQAVAEERRRIARELHDLAGHTLAAMLLHVTGARHVLRRDVDEVERALLEAERVGRSSLDQIRAAVVALRTTERGTDPPLQAGGGLGALVAEYRRAGLAIESTISIEAEHLGGPIGVALHRIGREALANVARHAPANRVEFSAEVGGDGDHVRLQICDHGQRTATVDIATDRFGVIGMRERARSLGGTLVAAAAEDGWRVAAVLPLSGGTAPGACRP